MTSRQSASRAVVPRFTADFHFWLALAAGPLAWAGLAASPAFTLAAGGAGRSAGVLVLAIVVYPVVEEWLFRGLVQPALARRFPFRALPGVSAANFHTSLLFALAHLAFHPPPLALATYFPSLVFGHCRERYGSIMPGTIVHMVYNAGFFLLLAPQRFPWGSPA